MTNLVKYKVSISVPDTENTGNYKAKGLVEITYNSGGELKEKLENYVCDQREFCVPDNILKLKFKIIDKI